MNEWQILPGDAADRLGDLDDASVQTCITSPPYWGLRDYGTAAWEGGDSECDHTQTIKPGSYNQGFNERWGNASGERKQEERGKRPFRDTCGKCGAKRIDSQLGLEPTPEEYVANLVAVFREVRRVLRDDGTVWLNLGDSYAGAPVGTFNGGGFKDKSAATGGRDLSGVETSGKMDKLRASGLKPKDLVGIPWRVAFALQADGWWLRSDIIWNKPNPMPESVTDRPTRAHEYIFLLTKSARYFFDSDAIREDSDPDQEAHNRRYAQPYDNEERINGGQPGNVNNVGIHERPGPGGRNKRSVWTVTTQPYAEAHFATFPPKLIEPCILAGSPPKCCGECGAPYVRLRESEQKASWHDHGSDGALGQRQVKMGQASWNEYEAPQTMGWKATCYHADSPAPDDSGRALVLDPFAGSGTTGVVALRHDRSFVGIELSADYCELARNRIRDDAPLLNTPLERGGD